MQTIQKTFRSPILLSLMVMAVGLSACSLPNKPVTTAAAVASKPISDGEILHVLHTINNGEIKQSETVLQRSANPQIQAAARQIIKDHTDLNQRVASLMSTTGAKHDESMLSRGLQTQTNTIAESLAGMSGQKLDCTYLQKQAEQHALSIDTINSQLMSAAKNPEVKNLLHATLPVLAQHQQMAKRGVASLSGCQ